MKNSHASQEGQPTHHTSSPLHGTERAKSRLIVRQSAQPQWRWMTHERTICGAQTGPWGLSSFLAGFLAVGPQTVTCPPNRVDDGLTELAAQVPTYTSTRFVPGSKFTPQAMDSSSCRERTWPG